MASAQVTTDNVSLRGDPSSAGAVIGVLAKDVTVTTITERPADNGITWVLVASQISGQTRVGWVEKSSITPDQALPQVVDWSKAPQVGSAGFHNRFSGQNWRFDASGVYLESEPDAPRRTKGPPITCTKILSLYGDEIFKASLKHGIPPELIVMTIATESAADQKSNFTGPPTFRWEAGHNTYSAGPMQTLATTAFEVIEKLGLPFDKNTVAQSFASEPVPPPAVLGLYDGATNIEIGTGEVALNNQRHQTGFDPILVAACYNHGSLAPSRENPWGLFTFGDHLNRASNWFGDACSVIASLRAGGKLSPQMVVSDPQVTSDDGGENELDIDGLLSSEADHEVDFFTDSGAVATKSAVANGFFSVHVTFPQAQDPIAPDKKQFDPPDLTQGYVLCLDRFATQQRKGMDYARTVSFYQAYFNGEKVADLFGYAAERQGPGDNGLIGKTQHRCLAAGSYPLFTHASATGKYATIGFATVTGLANRPFPCLGVENTGQREGILIHCAKGYLWSIGCINLASKLEKATDDINFSDSHARVIALIQSIRDKLGTGFPRNNDEQLPSVRLLIREHLPLATSDM
jgi:hypothetical protein